MLAQPRINRWNPIYTYFAPASALLLRGGY